MTGKEENKGRSFVIEFHEWRKWHREGGELGTVTTYGWVTVLFVPFLVSKWLKVRTEKLKAALFPSK